MPVDAYNTYMEGKVLGASPVELVQIVYTSALGSITKARAHVLAGNIKERSSEITRAQLFLIELQSSLDLQKGGLLSRKMAQLYAYMQARLSQANVEQKEEPLAEVERLLRILLQAWQECSPKELPDVAAEQAAMVYSGVEARP
jgi:flagellar protein FliS